MHAGRNVPFGIREHGMGAIVNGACAHGGIVKPYGSTFLMFSDYMRGSVRLSALMGLPVLWVWTHDSVGLGEDGPTHQPIEHFASLRAIPELWVIRPADANETTVAWRVALERDDGPVALLLSRQNIPVLDRDEVASAEGAAARRLRAVGLGRRRAPELILISTGAEVPTTLARRAERSPTTACARASSRCPAWSCSKRSPRTTASRCCRAAVRARLAVEPGASMSWWRWVGLDGDVLGLDRFGASAPGTKVLEKLGFTAENIAARARALLGARHRRRANAAHRKPKGARPCPPPRHPPRCECSPRSARASGSTSSRANQSAAGTCRS